ncbi:NAD(P)-binding domain-containing protein [Salipiger mangrovisoli]|uniref:NAD(P)-binding domain-containing protein n=1 Tax=Salipiger mangrovisoli TaxID=2865933 RepID=A0ABR9XB69_9RHOB|nr:NAD(P)-binding domain-containing protein [Salipiger mangrovisoli]MBE9640758.1 NAD(P)-binding domain-containing protein [Salipiger mangrovisoli]
MKLDLLLFILSRKLRAASRGNDATRALLRGRTTSVRIRTADNKAGRLFVFSDGAVFSKSGASGDADVTMTWKNAATAFRAMKSGDASVMARALEVGDLQLDGDMEAAQWFRSLTQSMNGAPERPGSDETVAVLGLGKMGSGLAHNIQRAGFDLVVYNRTASKAQPFVDAGGRLTETPRDAAAEASIIVTSLMDDTSVRDIVTSPEGILAGMKPGTIHMCATTISPELAQEMAELHHEKGCHFVSAAVVGRPDSAEAGKLISLLSGDDTAVARCMPVCESYSATTMRLGERAGLANYAKLSVNYFAVSSMELMGQIYAYGDAVGIDRAFYGRLFESSYANPTLKMYAAKIRDRDFSENVGFELTAGLKDVKLMNDASAATSGSLDFAPIIIEKMQKAIARGWDHRDWCAFTELSRPSKG